MSGHVTLLVGEEGRTVPLAWERPTRRLFDEMRQEWTRATTDCQHGRNVLNKTKKKREKWGSAIVYTYLLI